MDLVEDIHEIAEYLRVLEVVVLPDLVDLFEVQHLILVDLRFEEQGGDDSVSGGLIEFFHLSLLYVEGAIQIGEHVV